MYIPYFSKKKSRVEFLKKSGMKHFIVELFNGDIVYNLPEISKIVNAYKNTKGQSSKM